MTYAYTRTKKVRELRKRRVIFIVALQIEWIQKKFHSLRNSHQIRNKYQSIHCRSVFMMLTWVFQQIHETEKKYRNNQQSSFRINFDDVCIEKNSSTNRIANHTHENRIHHYISWSQNVLYDIHINLIFRAVFLCGQLKENGMLSVWIKYGGIGSWDVRLVFTTFLHSIRLFLSNFNEIFLISILFLCCWCVVGAQNQASTTGKKKSEEEMFHKECVDIHQAKCIQFHSLCNEMMNEK